MSRSNHIKSYFREATGLTAELLKDKQLHEKISIAATCIVNAIKDGKKVIACGNGGSMCDAMHFASELTGKYKERRAPLPVIALSDPAAMSCISNDFGYDTVFARQILALGVPRDVLLVISTSGNSVNILHALRSADDQAMMVIGLTGAVPPKEFSDFVDIEIRVPSSITNHIQEAHIKIIHILVELIEKNL